ncbi:MAG: NAD(P)-dependent glycerol-3-phosphate dehydrogenase [Acidimicrobiia bacterium]|nr:NAD(P)-dependent glycerol-3-phosphate dehydrogenase [Acidimicrobiia bacterium]NNL28810.1 NAD(P)-dependent glycerol-3-phosphate dehydrogenase [Acidimicrobiia bacterium]
MKIAVVGAGSWGTTMASLMAEADETVLWSRRVDVAEAINTTDRNPDYLGDTPLHPALTATTDLEFALAGAEIIVMAVPSHGTRSVLEAGVDYISNDALVVSLSKGFEQSTRLRMTEVALEVLDHDSNRLGVLTGPNLAKEVLGGQPTASVAAFPSIESAEILQAHIPTPTLRIYTSTDVIGCEAAGALKNVMAIGTGMAQGLGFGDNTRAALITRSLNELSRIGRAMGGDVATFAGLAGMGDLIATCSSPLSRNRMVGVALGEGRTLKEITRDMNMVAEGVKTTESVLAIAAGHGLDVPIVEQVGNVLYEGLAPIEAMRALLSRPTGREFDPI